jgi:hypothetical protein
MAIVYSVIGWPFLEREVMDRPKLEEVARLFSGKFLGASTRPY